MYLYLFIYLHAYLFICGIFNNAVSNSLTICNQGLGHCGQHVTWKILSVMHAVCAYRYIYIYIYIPKHTMAMQRQKDVPCHCGSMQRDTDMPYAQYGWTAS
jgi:hypothetical protein